MDEKDLGKMTGWDYRVLRDDLGDKDNEELAIHEVYYFENNGEEEARSYTKDPVSPRGDSMEELKKDAAVFFQAIEKPILNKSQFKNNES